MPQLLRTADGATLSVHIEGPAQAETDGPPVVLIHGWSMSGQFFRRQLPDLNARRKVIVPDLRGHGRSEKVLHGHTVPTYANDLAAILAGLGVERPVLVGWSMGAMIAYEFLRQSGPRSLSGIVIVDQPPSDFAWPGYEFGGFTADGLLEMNEQIQTNHAGLVSEFAQLMVHEPDPDTVAWMTTEILQVPPGDRQRHPRRPDPARLPRLPPPDRGTSPGPVRRGRQAHQPARRAVHRRRHPEGQAADLPELQPLPLLGRGAGVQPGRRIVPRRSQLTPAAGLCPLASYHRRSA